MIIFHSLGEDIRRYILEKAEKHPRDLSRVTAEHFGITRQAVNKHLQRLTAVRALQSSGHTRSQSYKLSPISEWRDDYELSPELAEDVVWTNDILPVIGQQPENVLDIWRFCFTDMFNNGFDHSGGTSIPVHTLKTAVNTDTPL